MNSGAKLHRWNILLPTLEEASFKVSRLASALAKPGQPFYSFSLLRHSAHRGALPTGPPLRWRPPRGRPRIASYRTRARAACGSAVTASSSHELIVGPEYRAKNRVIATLLSPSLLNPSLINATKSSSVSAFSGNFFYPPYEKYCQKTQQGPLYVVGTGVLPVPELCGEVCIP